MTALLWGVIGHCGIKNIRFSEWFLWLVSGMASSGKIFAPFVSCDQGTTDLCVQICMAVCVRV